MGIELTPEASPIIGSPSQDTTGFGRWVSPRPNPMPLDLERTRQNMLEHLKASGVCVEALKNEAAVHFTNPTFAPCGEIVVEPPSGELTDDDFHSWAEELSEMVRNDSSES